MRIDNWLKPIFVLFLALIITMSASADDWMPKHRNWFLIGGEFGLLEKSGVDAPEIENSGTEFGFKAIYARYYEDWVFDAGLGWRTDEMEDNSVSVETKAFFLELGARYRLAEHWSLGPVVSALVGDDVSFSDVGTNSDDNSTSLFVGGRLMYDIPFREQTRVLRLGVQAQTDIDIDNRQVTWVQALVEFGWPFGKQTYQDPPAAKVVEPLPVVEKKPPPLELNLMNAGVRFASGRAELVGDSQSVISRLASVLSKYNAQWTNVAILGHTDASGDYRRNMQLSRARAESVSSVLMEFGISRDKLTVAGFGPDRPLDERKTSEAYAKNRRVEVEITAANPSQDFVKELKAILQKAAEIE